MKQDLAESILREQIKETKVELKRIELDLKSLELELSKELKGQTKIKISIKNLKL